MKTDEIILWGMMLAVASCTQPSTPAAEQVEEALAIKAGEKDGIPTLTIGGLTWQAQNLDLDTPGSWCYGGDPENCGKTGRLYRWQIAQRACETLGEGWRLPTDKEWQQLAAALGGYHDWLTDQPSGDPLKGNEALLRDFGARLGGWRGSTGGFEGLGKAGCYWTATPSDEASAWYFQAAPSGGRLLRRQAGQDMGMSCRCVF